MPELKGKIISYNATNRQGKIRQESGGQEALFYITVVSNPEPTPKTNDSVVFEAPEPRKNKRGKFVQPNATTVTIEERAPEPPPSYNSRENRGWSGYSNNTRARGKFAGNRKSGRGERSSGSKRPQGSRSAAPARDSSRDPSRERTDRRAPRQHDAGLRVSNKRKPQSQFNIGVARIRLPLAADVKQDVIHMTGANPSLVLDKYIQWPNPGFSIPPLNPPVKVNSEQGVLSSQNPTATTPVADKALHPAWRFEERHKAFFYNKTLVPLYANFEKKRLPLEALQKREKMRLSALEAQGYSVVCAEFACVHPFAISSLVPSILGNCGIHLERLYGYPLIPAACIRDLLRQYLALHPEQVLPSSALGLSISRAEDRDPRLIFFDAIPAARLGSIRIKKLDCKPLYGSDKDLSESNQAVAGKRWPRLFSISLSPRAKFVLRIASREGDQFSHSVLALALKALEPLSIRPERFATSEEPKPAIEAGVVDKLQENPQENPVGSTKNPKKRDDRIAYFL